MSENGGQTTTISPLTPGLCEASSAWTQLTRGSILPHFNEKRDADCGAYPKASPILQPPALPQQPARPWQLGSLAPEVRNSRKLCFQRGEWMWMRSRAVLDGGRERGAENLPDGWGCGWIASSCSKRKHVRILCCSSAATTAAVRLAGSGGLFSWRSRVITGSGYHC